MTVDLSRLTAPGEKAKIIANLPYNIGTELLVTWLTLPEWPPFYESLTLMFQREVALRIAANAGDSAYGRLSVLCGWRTDAQIMFDIPPPPSPRRRKSPRRSCISFPSRTPCRWN